MNAHWQEDRLYLLSLFQILSKRICYHQRSLGPSAQALLKVLYLATYEATKKWSMPIKNWGKIRGELAIMYPGRLPD